MSARARPATALLALLLLAPAVTGCGPEDVQAEQPAAAAPARTMSAEAARQVGLRRDRCVRLTASLAQFGELRTFGTQGPRIGVLGDSYTAGEGLRNRAFRWAARLAELLPAKVHADGVGFSGFVSPGPCGGQRFADRADRLQGQPTVLVVGGLNDLRASHGRIVDAVAELVGELPNARVIIVGPVDSPLRKGERETDRALADGAERAGVEYLSMIDLRPKFLPEGLHLTAMGHLTFAERIADYLRAHPAAP